MTYSSIGKLATSPGLTKRVTACAAQEGAVNAQMWAMNHLYAIAASPGWADAWEYCENTMNENDNPDIGARSDVINDEMILAAVQPLVLADAEPPA